MSNPRYELLTRYDADFDKVGLGAYALDLSDCSDEFIEALGQFVRGYTARAQKPGDGRTIFECRTCGDGTQGNTDGTTDKPGWMLIEGIDGRNHICPTCVADPTSLDHLKADDLYPNVRIVPIR